MTEIKVVTLKCQDESHMCESFSKSGEGMIEFRTLSDGSSIPFCDYHWHVFQSFQAAMGE